MKAAEFWSVDNVTRFNGWDVENGEITLSDSEYEEILNEMYGEVSVCGQMFGSGSLLVDADPVAFSCAKGEYESHIQTELENQLEREDDTGIDFEEELEEELDEDDTYEEGYNARTNDESYDHSKSDEWQNGWNDADINEQDEE